MSSRIFEPRWRALALLSLLPTLSACRLTIDPPRDFLVLDRHGPSLRALSPEDARLRVREFDDPERGELDFWKRALEVDLVEHRGYTLLESRAVEDEAGRPGRELLCELTLEGRPYRYLVTIFLRSERDWLFRERQKIRVAEFVAEKTPFDALLEDVRKSLRSIRRTPAFL